MEYFETFVLANSIQSKVALIDEDAEATFGQLDKISTKLALVIRQFVRENEIKNLNPNADWLIAICVPPTIKLIYCMFAILKLGAGYIPIDHTLPEVRVVNMITTARPVLIISDSLPSTLSKFDAVAEETEVITLRDLLSMANEIKPMKLVPFPSKVKTLSERIAVVIFTSGSSGTAKGVRISHRTIMNRLNWQWETFPYGEEESLCFKSAFTFFDSVSEILAPLLHGYTLNIFSKLVISSPNLLMKAIRANRITRILVVPSLLRALLASLHLLEEEEEGKGKEMFESVRWVACSSETLHKELVEEFFVIFPEGKVLCNFYGSTEDAGDVAFEVMHSWKEVESLLDGGHVPLGVPIFNTVLYVLDEDLKLKPEGELGALYVAGYNLASGYVGIPNSEKFITNPYSNTWGFNRLYNTGDYARIVNKIGTRRLFFEGRKDTQVKVRGHRVDLMDVESAINSQKQLVKKSLLLVFNPGKDDQAIVAFIVPATKEVKVEEMQYKIKSLLKPYEVPQVMLIEEFPLMNNGKIDRQRLLAKFKSERQARGKYEDICGADPWTAAQIPPELKLQARALAEAVSDVIQRTLTDVISSFDDSFYNMGGTSLNSVTVVTKLRLKNFHISLDDFVSAKSLRETLPLIVSTHANAAGVHNTVGVKKHPKYQMEFLAAMHEFEATAIIANSFSRKGDLEAYTNVSFQDYKDFLRSLYPTILKKGLSFIVRRREDKRIIAVALNFDRYDEPRVSPAAPGLQTIFDFLEFVETPLLEKLPKGHRKVLHAFMMGTHEMIAEADNVPLLTFMEDENLRMATDKNFVGIFCTSTSPLTMELCTEVFGYEILLEYQLNQFVEPDGSRPFRLAPDSQIVLCCWKRLRDDDEKAETSKGKPKGEATSGVRKSLQAEGDDPNAKRKQKERPTLIDFKISPRDRTSLIP